MMVYLIMVEFKNQIELSEILNAKKLENTFNEVNTFTAK